MKVKSAIVPHRNKKEETNVAVVIRHFSWKQLRYRVVGIGSWLLLKGMMTTPSFGSLLLLSLWRNLSSHAISFLHVTKLKLHCPRNSGEISQTKTIQIIIRSFSVFWIRK
jgi:hypothetical protein